MCHILGIINDGSTEYENVDLTGKLYRLYANYNTAKSYHVDHD